MTLIGQLLDTLFFSGGKKSGTLGVVTGANPPL